MRDLAASLVMNRRLAYDMAVRELKVMTKGAYLGLLWIVLKPLLQVLIYVFIVTVVFNARLGEGAGTFDYAVFILGGIVPWLFLSQMLQDATSLVREKVGLLKQVAYPIEALPVERFIVHGVGFAVGLAIYMGLAAATGWAHPTWLLLPLPLALLAVFVVGMSWVFMLVGVVFKDLRDIVAIVLGFLIFVSPVLFGEAAVGAKVWTLILLNPLSHFIVCFRDIFVSTFHPWSWAIAVGLAAASASAGAWLVVRTKTRINEYL